LKWEVTFGFKASEVCTKEQDGALEASQED